MVNISPHTQKPRLTKGDLTALNRAIAECETIWAYFDEPFASQAEESAAHLKGLRDMVADILAGHPSQVEEPKGKAS